MAKKGSGSSDNKKIADNKKGKAKPVAEDDGEEKQTKVSSFGSVALLIQRQPVVLKGKSALKAANAINVRHVLCEKHSKATEALEKIKVVRRLLDPSPAPRLINDNRRVRHSTKLHKNIQRTKPKVRWNIHKAQNSRRHILQLVEVSDG
jgi:hypothetical protein